MSGSQSQPGRTTGAGPRKSLPPPVAFLVVAAVFAAGVITGGVIGAVLLAALGLFVLAMVVSTWSRLRTPDRVLRIVVLAILVGVIVSLFR
ncbi:DUF6703 family protein [Crossiella cryophila]|uniref:VIT1/CCC1 family predicted Fe2+/Mn2+ transporter n=1 Tax=Crossiella cryophila TaxID=43355 RepID=A0A7W7C8C4_9PSEU|nr:DUF6703 family protein [Crossiella cryophila]MBB4676424.1 VIT1/CCC1 family predicted Fe2+/Mn2+ transporter [Crossiella cryophila]